MNVVDVYPESGASKLSRFIIIMLILIIIALLGVAGWSSWMWWQLSGQAEQVEPVELSEQTVIRIDIGGGMQVVAAQFDDAIQIQQATLVSQENEVYETVTSIEEPVNNLGFLIPQDLVIKEIQITPAEGAAFTYGGEK